ncbi:prepilin-type N-terminal cleavage/methylation domain-containing protein [Patescibacteria group bacterium]|nr:prepilin-type N-terminal cleavage/methylation domain-containing protein [Patescibacteria group bacterium]
MSSSKTKRHIKYRRKTNRGFTIVEVLVSFAVFTLVITGSIGAMISIINANRKTQALQLVINNLNFALESMTRIIRIGHGYHCRSDLPGSFSAFAIPLDCPGGGTYLAVESSKGSSSDDLDQVVFRYDAINTRIERSTDSGQNWFPITAPEVLINDLKFTAVGTDSSDNKQPIVTITINGSAGTSQKTITEFKIQTSVSQRIVDF